MSCSDKKYVRIICGGQVVVCGDTEEDVNSAAEDAIQNDPRCQSMSAGSAGGGGSYEEFSPPT